MTIVTTIYSRQYNFMYSHEYSTQTHTHTYTHTYTHTHTRTHTRTHTHTHTHSVRRTHTVALRMLTTTMYCYVSIVPLTPAHVYSAARGLRGVNNISIIT